MSGAATSFFGLDLQHHVVTRNRHYYPHLRNLGVKVYFLIHDLLPIQFPQYFRAGSAEEHHNGYPSSRRLTALFACRAQWPISTSIGLPKSGVSRLRPLAHRLVA